MGWLRLMGWLRWVCFVSSWFLVLCSWLRREKWKKRRFNHEKTRKNAKAERGLNHKKRKRRKKGNHGLRGWARIRRKEKEFYPRILRRFDRLTAGKENSSSPGVGLEIRDDVMPPLAHTKVD
jgi:hypothetical protein